MRIVRPATRLMVLVLLCAGTGRAQESAPAPPAPGVTGKDLATVHVYRIDQDVAIWFTRTLPVYFADLGVVGQKQRKVAGLRKKRYFMMRLPPGKYTFDTQGMDGKLELEAEAGGEYYLRLERGNDCPSEDPDYWFLPSNCESRPPSVERMSPERGREEILKVKPIKRGNVKDRKLVIIPPETPPEDPLRPAAP